MNLDVITTGIIKNFDMFNAVKIKENYKEIFKIQIIFFIYIICVMLLGIYLIKDFLWLGSFFILQPILFLIIALLLRKFKNLL
jgi:uncharacterized membrane protein